ncbi:hypothetical protein G7Y31_07870 [Corynebacterium lizhenjunii]|uniref:Uncharacterized protein n=1 Tax=Corynebacterium lizhenjunii TaxID=2709394 RepID=A0A7T0PA03_9CORY|nr:hypothetical protein [Corynebacterium lizhenjunii]QPK78481.1 hypothetical protein G7Y31_07870 [Corynebacterium lizhenjunii]
MTLQPRPNNPIEQRKQAVRKHSRNVVVSVAVGAGVGLVGAWMFANEAAWLILGLIIAVVGGVYNWAKINKIINHKDQY